jgi:hypothetical protein
LAVPDPNRKSRPFRCPSDHHREQQRNLLDPTRHIMRQQRGRLSASEKNFCSARNEIRFLISGAVSTGRNEHSFRALAVDHGHCDFASSTVSAETIWAAPKDTLAATRYADHDWLPEGVPSIVIGVVTIRRCRPLEFAAAYCVSQTGTIERRIEERTPQNLGSHPTFDVRHDST